MIRLQITLRTHCCSTENNKHRPTTGSSEWAFFQPVEWHRLYLLGYLVNDINKSMLHISMLNIIYNSWVSKWKIIFVFRRALWRSQSPIQLTIDRCWGQRILGSYQCEIYDWLRNVLEESLFIYVCFNLSLIIRRPISETKVIDFWGPQQDSGHGSGNILGCRRQIPWYLISILRLHSGWLRHNAYQEFGSRLITFPVTW